MFIDLDKFYHASVPEFSYLFWSCEQLEAISVAVCEAPLPGGGRGLDGPHAQPEVEAGRDRLAEDGQLERLGGKGAGRGRLTDDTKSIRKEDKRMNFVRQRGRERE